MSISPVARLTAVVTLLLACAHDARADLLAVDWFGNAWLIDECTGEALASTPTGFVQLNSLARNSQGEFFTVGSVEPFDIFAAQILLTIDPATGIATPVATIPLDVALEGTVRALAFSPEDVLYATVRTPFADGDALLYTIDVNTGETTLIGDSGTDHVQGLAFSENGILYGLDGLGRLGVIDVNVGTITAVGDAPRNRDLNSLGFGPAGTMYTAGNDFPELYTLNLQTGEATLVGTGAFSDLRGLEYIPGSSPIPVPPTVACSVATPTLSTPNGSLVDVGLRLDVQDDDDPDPIVAARVYSNEAGAEDVEFSADGLALRAERLGGGAGRVYLIVVSATDHCGATGIDCCTVVVPHDSSAAAGSSIALDADLAELTCDTTGSPPEGYVLIGDAGNP